LMEDWSICNVSNLLERHVQRGDVSGVARVARYAFRLNILR
jgi:hypothetical protein